MTKLYRVHEQNFEDGTRVFINSFTITKETPCGYWIDYYYTKKFVLKNSKKKFACSSITDAIFSFKKRKERQLSILKAQIDNIERALEIPDKDYIECNYLS